MENNEINQLVTDILKEVGQILSRTKYNDFLSNAVMHNLKGLLQCYNSPHFSSLDAQVDFFKGGLEQLKELNNSIK